ncbi:MAG: DMT family transporter [Eubacteriales bacterium]
MSKSLASILAVLAAVLYAISIPLSKILLDHIPPIFMAGFLYLGAGLGVSLLYLLKKDKSADTPLTKEELPYTVGMIVLDTLAPIFLMIGLLTASPSSASLLNNFEIVATAVIALVVFKEKISPMLSLAIILIVCASILLSVGSFEGLDFQIGSLFILLACVCWGFENNCTRVLSSKSTHQIVMLKGIFSGLGSILTAIFVKEATPTILWIFIALILGFVSYGLSIFVYIKAQSVLGAAKTSAYYSLSPFIGVLLSLLLFGISPNPNFLIACGIMIIATTIIVMDTFELKIKAATKVK